MKEKTALVTGGLGMVGMQLVPLLAKKYKSVLVADSKPYNGEYDHLDNVDFEQADLVYFDVCRELCEWVDHVYHLAGIKGSPSDARDKPSRFFVPMLQFNTNMMEAARLACVEWYVYTSTVGVYHPAEIFVEDEMWNDFPSENDRFPAWAKRMGELQADAYKIEYGLDNISIVRPANIYGPYDNFGEHSQVIPSLIKKAVNNDVLEVWGDGSAIRDFIYSEDVALGILHMVENKVNEPVNLSSGIGVSIKEVAEIVGGYFDKDIIWDVSKPNGDLKRVLDTARAESYGFTPTYTFDRGLIETIEWYLE